MTDEHISYLPKHAKIYTGMARSYLKKLCSKHQIEIVELFERDDVSIYNSIPTAEGALMMAIQNTDITIHGSQCLVLGFGRTGFTLSKTLHSLGAIIKVGDRKDEHLARAYEMGFQAFSLNQLNEQVADADLIFNTIPSLVLTPNVLTNVQHRAVIIDIASKPGGTDFRFAEKRGIKALFAPSLPGMVAPKTAGQIIANALIHLLMKESSTVELVP